MKILFILKGGQAGLCSACCEARGIKAMPLLLWRRDQHDESVGAVDGRIGKRLGLLAE